MNNKDKVGKDAEELVGIAPVGGKAANSMDDIIALKPDCVIYRPQVNRVHTSQGGSQP